MDRNCNSVEGHRNRLRKKFLQHPNSLFDYEILELILFYAVPRKDTKPLAKFLLKKFGSINNLFKQPPQQLMEIPGLTPNVAVLFCAIKVLSKKIISEKIAKTSVVKSWGEIINYCSSILGGLQEARLLVVFLDSKHCIIGEELVTEGSVNSLFADHSLIIKKCFAVNAAAFIVAHNHPSGNVQPSREDITFTRKLNTLSASLNIYLYDHLVVSNDEVYSFREHGLI